MDLSVGNVLPLSVLDAIPNPVLVKDAETRYVWVNEAFERLFSVSREDLVSRLDTEVFPGRQAAQCNGGDVRVLSSGDTDEAVETVIDPVLGERETITRKSRLVVEGQYYLVGVMHDITEVVEKNRQLAEIGRVLVEQSARLEVLASTDPLTEVLNRRALFEKVEAVPDDRLLGVLSIDLDRFKSINDTYGHDGGDAVLVDFAAKAKALLRPDDLIGRIGGEEFVVLLAGADRHYLADIAERIRLAAADSAVPYGDAVIRYTVSIGTISSATQDTATLQDLLRVVDDRLYQAKRAGRNQVVSTS